MDCAPGEELELGLATVRSSLVGALDLAGESDVRLHPAVTRAQVALAATMIRNRLLLTFQD